MSLLLPLTDLFVSTLPQIEAWAVLRALIRLLGALLIIFPVLYFLIRRPNDWQDQILAAALILVAGIALAFLFGGWQAAVIAIMAAGVTILLAVVIGLFMPRNGQSPDSGAVAKMRRKLGKQPVTQVIDEGKTVEPSDHDPPLDPHPLEVRPYNAVIMQNNSRHTRILGPGEYETQASEYVKHAFYLRQRQFNRNYSDIKTADGNTAELSLSACYSVYVSEAAKQGRSNLSITDMKSLMQIAASAADLESSAADVVEHEMRKIFQTVTAAHLNRLVVLDHLEHRILRLAQERAGSNGICIETVKIKTVQVNPLASDDSVPDWEL